MSEIEELELQEKHLRERLNHLPNKKWRLVRIIGVGILSIFLMPLLPTRRGKTLAEGMGYFDAAFLISMLCVILIPIACYLQIKKVNDEISEIEVDLEYLKKKKAELINPSNQ